MNIELEKFITGLDEHFKKLAVTDEHVKLICDCIGRVTVSDCLGSRIHDVVDEEQLKEEVKKIIQGNRADLIYEYQAFVEDFVKKEEKEEDEESD